MFRKIIGWLKYFKYSPVNRNSLTPSTKLEIEKNIPEDIHQIQKRLEEIFTKSPGLVIRPFKVKTYPHCDTFIAYIEGLINTDTIESNILKPLIEIDVSDQLDCETSETIIETLMERIITSVNSFTEESMNTIIENLLKGAAVIFIESTLSAIVIPSKGWETRGIVEPSGEMVTRGPREGFNEDIETNITLIRRKIKSHKLKFEFTTKGAYSKTDIALCYIEGIANPETINELKDRIEGINLDAILESGYIEQFISDQPLSPFPTVGYTEKPDVVVGKMLEGRIAILCDGTPFVLTVPNIFVEYIQTSEDYYIHWSFASVLRILRFFALILTVTLPGIYVAMQTFHQQIIPYDLYLSIASARDPIPISSFTEAFLMIVIFELIREAGTRMPKPIGQVVSIVGAIVLGQAIVDAGVASPLMVIVISLTAITSFIIPSLYGPIFLSRLFILILANIVGFYGVVFALITIFIHLCNLRSFGANYLAPFAPAVYDDLKDAYIRAPLWTILIKRR